MQKVRVIVLIGDAAKPHYEEEAWARLTSEQFLAGYNDTDSIYDLPG